VTVFDSFLPSSGFLETLPKAMDSLNTCCKKNAQQAVLQAQKNINEGYKYIVEIDLKNFFDEVEHYILLELIYRKIKCPITLRLIRKWLRSPIQIEGELIKRRMTILNY
jgi:retron-type reverse transcriptase